MNFSTLPPWRSTIALAVSKYRDITWRRLSGSMRSPRAVEPVTSEKRTVTTLRTSRAGAASASGAPHESQKRAPSRFSAPQVEQTSILK
jgi:hypothetical protein